MTDRDFRLLTARVSLAAPMGQKSATPKAARPRLRLRPRTSAKPTR